MINIFIAMVNILPLKTYWLVVSRAAGGVGKDVRTLASADDMWHTG